MRERVGKRGGKKGREAARQRAEREGVGWRRRGRQQPLNRVHVGHKLCLCVTSSSCGRAQLRGREVEGKKAKGRRWGRA